MVKSKVTDDFQTEDVPEEQGYYNIGGMSARYTLCVRYTLCAHCNVFSIFLYLSDV